MSDASITIVVIKEDEPDPLGFGGLGLTTAMVTGRPYMAFVAANPQLRANGQTEEDAIERLRALLMSYIPKAKARRVVDLRFDELLVEEVMGS